jgi:hypothetical protein
MPLPAPPAGNRFVNSIPTTNVSNDANDPNDSNDPNVCFTISVK